MLPNTVEDIPVGENSDVDVWNEDVVEAAFLLVPEEGVRHPDPVRVGHRQVLQFAWKSCRNFWFKGSRNLLQLILHITGKVNAIYDQTELTES